MSHSSQIRVEIENDQACVTTGDGRFHVAQTGKSNAMASCPMFLMLGALGSCIMLTLKAVAENKEIDLGDTHILLDYDQKADGQTRFQIDMKLAEGLSDREQKILFRSAQLCEVGKILKSDISIDYQLIKQASEPSCDPAVVNIGR